MLALFSEHSPNVGSAFGGVFDTDLLQASLLGGVFMQSTPGTEGVSVAQVGGNSHLADGCYSSFCLLKFVRDYKGVLGLDRKSVV